MCFIPSYTRFVIQCKFHFDYTDHLWMLLPGHCTYLIQFLELSLISKSSLLTHHGELDSWLGWPVPATCRHTGWCMLICTAILELLPSYQSAHVNYGISLLAVTGFCILSCCHVHKESGKTSSSPLSLQTGIVMECLKTPGTVFRESF